MPPIQRLFTNLLTSNSYRSLGQTLTSLLVAFTFLSKSALANSVCIANQAPEPPTFTPQDLQTFLDKIPVIQANPLSLYTGFWTNWYSEPTLEGSLAKLSVQRGILDLSNLIPTYPPDKLTGNLQPGELICDDDALATRTLDGSCNDLEDPAMGALLTRFGRNVSLEAAYPNPPTLMDPDPRLISRRLLRRRGQGETIPFLNLWAAAWVQFQVHDWFDHGPSDLERPLAIPLAPDDPIRRETGQTQIIVGSTPRDTTRQSSDAGLPPTYQNYVTHWWDASQVYGSDIATANRLRSFSGGRLKLDAQGRLPLGDRGFGDAGFRSNWWLGLEMLHTLFVQEHNAIADHLAVVYPDFTDQQLYDKARMVNAALIAKIHTLEWTPAILPNRTLDIAMNANWDGLNQYLTPPFPETPAVKASFSADLQSALFGIVGGDRDLKGVPFSLTEEFAAVYRMHQLTPDYLNLINFKGRRQQPQIRRVATLDATYAGARNLYEQYRPEELALSFGRQNPGALTLQNYPRFMTNLETPAGIIDLGAIDILRDRERGIPRYNEFRRQLKLIPLESINQLTSDRKLQKVLNQVYGGDIEKVDLFVGTLAESQRPDCFGFGETLFQTFILMASRRLQADRFYTNDYTAETYTQAGLDWVDANNMKTVLLRHLPVLEETGLGNIENAFKPWPLARDGERPQQSDERLDSDWWQEPGTVLPEGWRM